MGQKPQILVDTDIIIKVYRGHSKHRDVLDKEKGSLAVSAITYFELLHGLKTRQRIIEMHKQMRAFQLYHLSENISQQALDILNKYSVSNRIRLADVLIAATAITSDLMLFTDNKQDFDFIQEITLYQP